MGYASDEVASCAKVLTYVMLVSCLLFCFSSSEAVMTMLHVKKHIQYLQATCHILIKSTNHTKYATNWRMDNGCAQELICEAGDLNTTVTEFKKQVSQLKNEVSPEYTVEVKKKVSKNVHHLSVEATSQRKAGRTEMGERLSPCSRSLFDRYARDCHSQFFAVAVRHPGAAKCTSTKP